MSRSKWILFVVATGLLAALISSAPAFGAADATCQPLFDSAVKVHATSAHVYNTETVVGGKTKVGEAIYANGIIYILVEGKWIRSKMTTEDLLKQQQENIRNSKTSCRHMRDEMVNGEAAALYSAQSDNDGIKSDVQTWISKSRGVPLRTEQNIDTGDPDTRHMSIRYEYSNVHAPAVQQ